MLMSVGMVLVPSRREDPLRLLILICVLMLGGGRIEAADADQRLIARGAELAQAQCGQCHAVGASDEAAHPITPPLRDLYEDFPIPMLTEALATGVVSGHDEMPMFEFTRDDITALLAYIDALNPGKPSYLRDVPVDATSSDAKK